MKFFAKGGKCSHITDSGRWSVTLLMWTFVAATFVSATVHHQLPSAKSNTLNYICMAFLSSLIINTVYV